MGAWAWNGSRGCCPFRRTPRALRLEHSQPAASVGAAAARQPGVPRPGRPGQLSAPNTRASLLSTASNFCTAATSTSTRRFLGPPAPPPWRLVPAASPAGCASGAAAAAAAAPAAAGPGAAGGVAAAMRVVSCVPRPLPPPCSSRSA